MHHRTALLAALPLAFSGCEFFQDVADGVEGLLEPVAAVGLTIVVDAPSADVLADLGLSSDTLSLPEAWQEGVAATVFLADARKVSDLDQTLLRGADIELSGCGADVLLDETEGAYTHVDDGTFDGCAGPFTATRTDVDPGALLPMDPPAAVDADVPTTWTAGDAMVLDLSADGVSHALTVVIEADTGTVTHTNEPASMQEWFQLLTGNQDLSAVTIPGTAFPDDTAVIVVTVPLQRTRGAQLDEVNTALSVVAGGRGSAWPVVVGDLL